MLFCRERFAVFEDETSLLYQYDPTLGWFPTASTTDRFLASRVIGITNNSLGFRAAEFSPDRRPRLLFLGDSFVWGFDVEASERFTDKLQGNHPEWNVFNLGVSGYGTDQEYLLLQRYFDRLRPQVVFLVFCTETDPFDNSWNSRYGGYFKPYYLVEGSRLRLRGVPVPRCERVFVVQHPLLSESYVVRLLVRAYYKLVSPPEVHNPDPTAFLVRDMRDYVQSKGAVLLVGLTAPHPPLQEVLQHFGIPWMDLSTPLRYSQYGQHWTPDGHTAVCERIEKFLLDGKYLETTNSTAP